ncbi:MAG: hypothetical protein QF463_03085 [Vicinamibacterales bacterium]|jgi:hypothetical protein|nr:hypothetical protein [Acidobacteriota bacterium]MDP6371683.1 hypothetical protein [Vicinamibacterales bacterium]MDP6608028.1 hypothetical protein [Vicinamibacterales bacterium]HAK54603.1 hypothetical protein [Acidobacteriota bacterium]|tara:strand:+ start:27127 stop:27360 length:234 start_codon:yes stop_codon:yes gene_type:complete
MRRPQADFEALLQRIRAEYAKTPGLSLTLAQAQRLWDLDRNACLVVLTALVDDQFLRREPDGRYVRVESSAASGSVA